jgi:hypothetical protein
VITSSDDGFKMKLILFGFTTLSIFPFFALPLFGMNKTEQYKNPSNINRAILTEHYVIE